MAARKLQIFLSSTYRDLIDYRLSAIEAILAAGHIPATMEQFRPGDETAVQVIERWIMQSDAVILLLGGRLGSLEPKSGKAYIELEYELATKLNKPLFAMVMSPAALQKRVEKLGLEVADEREYPAEYKAFKAMVTNKVCSFINDEKDVRIAIFQKLPEWAQREDLEGWVRRGDAIPPKVAEEIARLSSENAALRAAAARSAAEFDGLTFGEIVNLLKNDRVDPSAAEYYQTTEFGRDSPVKKLVHAGHVLEAFLPVLDRGPASVGSELPEMPIFLLGQRCLVGSGIATSRGYELALTEMGRRLRNRLVVTGALDERLSRLWAVDGPERTQPVKAA